MPLFDRHCQECSCSEEDRVESIHSANVIICPNCKMLSFAKRFTAPHLPPDGMYSFNQQLDNARQAASDGHGNASYSL